MSYENKSTFLPRRQAWGRDVEESALVGKSSRSPRDTQTQVPASSAVTKGQRGRWRARKEKPFLPCSLSLLKPSVQFSSVQSLIRVWLSAGPWTAAHQASLSITNSQSLPECHHDYQGNYIDSLEIYHKDSDSAGATVDSDLVCFG